MSDGIKRPLRDVARELQHKLAFYTVALAFSVLALSVETVKFTMVTWFGRALGAVEVLAWASLLLSGLAGLSWLSWAHRHFHALADIEEQVPRDGSTEMIARKKASRYQRSHVALLQLGIVLAVISRAIGAVHSAATSF